MKKLFFIIGNLFLLVSCKSEYSIEYSIEREYKAYALNTNSNNIELVNIEYCISDYNDLFLLYTKYLNNLPLGYIGCGCPEVNLADSFLKDNIVYYVVDEYYCLIPDLETFSNILRLSNKLLGYNDMVIYYKNKIIA